VEEVDGLGVLSQFLQSLDFHPVSGFSLDSHFVFAGVLHKENMDDVEYKENLSLPHFNLVAVQKDRHNH